MSFIPTEISESTAARIDEICGGAARRSPTVRALASIAPHTDCGLATSAMALGVSMEQLLKGTKYEPTTGQSPFAFQRGNMFESLLRKDNYKAALELLHPKVKGAIAVNLRKIHADKPQRMSLRAQTTKERFQQIIDGSQKAPHLLDGPVLRATVGGRPAYFEADNVAARGGDRIRVVEVKSFPKVDHRIHGDKLGAALDQIGIYLYLIRDLIAELGGDPMALVSTEGLLITPKNVGMTPTLSRKDVRGRIDRAGRVLHAIPDVKQVIDQIPIGLSFGAVATGEESQRVEAFQEIAAKVGTRYKPACLSNCGGAKLCREGAFCDQSPQLLGLGMERMMPGIATLDRAAELTEGADPTEEESAAAAHLERAGAMIDQVQGALA